MKTPNKFPILIVSTNRVGSTALIDHICSTLNTKLKIFVEPNYYGPDRLKEFQNYIKNNQKYIVKVHAIHFDKYEQNTIEYLTQSPDVYRIKISRLNIVKQIASYYLLKIRNITHYTENKKFDDVCPINHETLNFSINWILNANKHLSDCNLHFDDILYYEDFAHLNSKYVITPKPKNYNEIITLIEFIIRSQSSV